MPLIPNSIREDRQDPVVAKQVRLQCPHCHGMVYVTMPYKPTALQRQTLIRGAIDEHRRVCASVAAAEEGRVYTISYPRA